MKNPKARTPKKSAQASRTMTRQSAMNSINRGPDSLNLTSSELGANEIADLKRKFADGEVFELPDSDSSAAPAVQNGEHISQDSGKEKENDKQQSTKEKPQTRLPLPPKPFTIISAFRK
jgi:hypothetical protein